LVTLVTSSSLERKIPMKIDINKPSLMTVDGEKAIDGFSPSQNNWLDIDDDLDTHDWSRPLLGCTATLFFYTVTERNQFVEKLVASADTISGLGLVLQDNNHYTLETAAGMVSKHSYDAGVDIRGQLYKE
ncbi:hypothetical protein, partial [Lentilactobacillus kisonensis]